MKILKRVNAVESERNVTYDDLVLEINDKAEDVCNAMEKVRRRFEYRMIKNTSYSIEEASKIEDKMWNKLNEVEKEVMKLYNLVG